MSLVNYKKLVGQSTESGVGLIEVLIAVLVFTVGMLGLASMQLAAKRAGYEATQRSIATGLSRDILERMRSNPGELVNYVAVDLGKPGALQAVPNPDCSTAICPLPANMAAYDLYDWESLLIGAAETVDKDNDGTADWNAGGLVDARACISNVDGNVMVEIAWKGVNEYPYDSLVSICGFDSGAYDKDVAEDNLYRRVMVMTTYIGAT